MDWLETRYKQVAVLPTFDEGCETIICTIELLLPLCGKRVRLDLTTTFVSDVRS